MIKFIEYKKVEWSDSKQEMEVVETTKLPIRVSYLALKNMKEELNRSLSVNDDGTDYEAYESLLFHSLSFGYRLIKKPMPFKKEDMPEVMDQIYMKFMKLVPEFFSDSKPDVKNGGKVGKK